MSREKTIRQIVHRDVEHLGLTEEIVQKQDAKLHQSACDQFGTWETALKYAGVDARLAHTGRPYSRDRVIQKIRSLCILCYSLATTRNKRRDRRLYDAARHHFGSWKKALQAAGINLEYAFLPRPRKHDKQQVLETLQKRRDSGLSLVWADVCTENRALATAARQMFGSWKKSLIAVKVDPKMHRYRSNKWDRQRVIDCLKERHKPRKVAQV